MSSVHDIEGGWLVRWRQGDRNRGRTFKKQDGFTKDDAEELARNIRREKKLGGVDPLASEQNFWTVVEEWWPGHSRGLRSSRTRENQLSYLENDIRPEFGGERLCDVNRPKRLRQFRDELRAAGRGEPTIRKILYVLSAILAQAREDELVQSNAMEAIDKPSGQRQRIIQPFPPERVELIRSWFLAMDNDPERAAMVSLLAYAGPRPEEAYERLTWADILDNSIIFRGDKTDRDRVTRLLAPLAADLKDWQKESGRAVGQVFGWSHSNFHSGFRRRFQRAAQECGIEMTRPYDLRHAFASLLAAEGRGIDYIAIQLGHSVETCSRHYRHLVEDASDHRNAEERIWEARAVHQPFIETGEQTP